MNEKLEKFRRLGERLVYIKRVLVTFMGLSALIKLVEEVVPNLPIQFKEYINQMDISFIALTWLVSLVAYFALSEVIVQVNSKIRRLEKELIDKSNPSKCRRSLQRSKFMPPPRS